MQFSNFAILAFVASTLAAPGLTPYGGSKHKKHVKHVKQSNQCSETQQASCCNSPDGTPALGLQCALSAACSGSVQCCDVDGNGGLIALNLCVPISINL